MQREKEKTRTDKRTYSKRDRRRDKQRDSEAYEQTNHAGAKERQTAKEIKGERDTKRQRTRGAN